MADADKSEVQCWIAAWTKFYLDTT